MKSFRHHGLTFSYLDSGGTGDLIVALHAMWMEARTFEPFQHIAVDGPAILSAYHQRRAGRCAPLRPEVAVKRFRYLDNVVRRKSQGPKKWLVPGRTRGLVRSKRGMSCITMIRTASSRRCATSSLYPKPK
jgi:hypothetical protein